LISIAYKYRSSSIQKSDIFYTKSSISDNDLDVESTSTPTSTSASSTSGNAKDRQVTWQVVGFYPQRNEAEEDRYK
jgi:hypothetical protein